MKRAVVCAVLVLVTLSAYGQETMVLGYYPSYRHGSYPHTAIKFEHLTHLAHSFIWPDTSGSGALHVPAGFLYPAMIEAAHNAGVKVVIALGGAGNNDGFGPAASDPETRAVLVENIVDFVVDNGYDGVDLDWEGFSNSTYKDALSSLIEDLDAALEAADPALTLSMPLGATNWHGAYDMPRVAEHLDWIAIMTYDLHGSWTTHAGHLSPLYPATGDSDHFSMHQSVDYWMARSVPASKMLAGIPFYGRQWEGVKALHGPTVGAVTALGYAGIEPLVETDGWVRHWDEVARVPYLINEDEERFITYEDPISVAEKVEYVRTRNLQGLILWEISHDYMPTGEQPLLVEAGKLLQDPVAIEDRPVPETDFVFEGNFPNPFSSSTRISFSTAATAHVTIEVFDVLGRRVAILVDEVLPAGRHTANLEASHLPSGIYVSRMRTGDVSRSISMLLIRL